MDIEKTMSINEVATIFGVTPEALKKHIRKIYPDKMQNGIETRLNETEITELKKRMIPTTQVVGATTDIEMQEMTLKVMQYHIDRYNAMKQALAVSEMRVNRLIHDSKTYTTTEIAKELNLKSAKELNIILESKGIQYKVNNTWVLSAKYSDCGYESIKQQELDNGKVIYNRHWTGKGRDFIVENITKE